MKLSIILAFVAAATVVSAEANAIRFSRGMGPRAPVKRSSKSNSADRHKPSSTAGGSGNQCGNGGTQKCCNHTGTRDDPTISNALKNASFDAIISFEVLVGLECSANLLGGACDQQSVCCNHGDTTSLIAWDCNSLAL